MSAQDATAWIRKARQDARSARRLLIDPPEPEDAAFHVHQAAEKAFKAILVAAGIRYPRGRGAGHDLNALAALIPGSAQAQAHVLADLTPWATAFRYPADDPHTAEPAPDKPEIERRLAAVEAFIAAAEARISGPGR